jgi:hypothetical protein
VSRLLKSLQRIESQGQPANEGPSLVSQANADAPGAQSTPSVADQHADVPVSASANAGTLCDNSTASSTLARLNALQELMAAEWGESPAVPSSVVELSTAVEDTAASAVANQIDQRPDVDTPVAIPSSVPIADDLLPADRSYHRGWENVVSVEAIAPDCRLLTQSSVSEAVEAIDSILSDAWNVEVPPRIYSPAQPDSVDLDNSSPAENTVANPAPSVVPLSLAAAGELSLLPIRDEYSQLRDHLLSQFSLPMPCTILLIDAGGVENSAWLMPLAVSFWQHLAAHLTVSGRVDASDDFPRVLIVESGANSSGIAENLGLQSPAGLTDVLLEKAALFSAIQHTPHPYVDLLTGGHSQLSSNMAGSLAIAWQELQNRYELVLVAGGPWKCAENQRGCDPASLIGLAQAVLLCVEANSSPRITAIRAADDLRQRGANLLGCIVRT